MSTVPRRRMTPEEYLAREHHAEIKSEFFAGEAFAMAGASPAHVLIATNLAREIGNQLRCPIGRRSQ